jgi:murein DD-endopeptidase MepM/ murein hydrolase activator NlpD
MCRFKQGEIKMLSEPLVGLFDHSKLITLDFAKITKNIPPELNIQQYFEDLNTLGDNPRLPENRQKFNNRAIDSWASRYLVGAYGEDRIAMLSDTPAGREGRTIHMAIDIFSKELEPVYAPCDGEIIVSNYEEGFGEYGNYLIIRPDAADYYIFLGHLGSNRMGVGPVKNGQKIAHLGDHANCENGGWSRHLHLQILKVLPPKKLTPQGYSTKGDFAANSRLYPNPLDYFPGWRLQ